MNSYIHKSDATVFIEAIRFNGFNIKEIYYFLKTRNRDDAIRIYYEIMIDEKKVLTIINKSKSYSVNVKDFIAIEDGNIKIYDDIEFFRKYESYNIDKSSNDSTCDIDFL